ncbi:MAG: hypothetical protein OER90_11970 [Gemmatimonadota bacterium]|nr:hypothetical protein [Gemmatimonadota bacterium]
MDRWYEFVRAKAPDGNFGPVITTSWVIEFARNEAMEAAGGGG